MGEMLIKRWLLGVLLLAVGLFILMMIGMALAYGDKAKTNLFGDIVPVGEWLFYTTDEFYELRWRWNNRDGGEVKDLNAYCPKCDYQMFPAGISRKSVVSFRCDICEKQYEIKESWDTIASVIPRRIQQKLRTGTYPKAKS